MRSDKVLQEDLTKHMEQECNCCRTKTHLPVLKSYMTRSRRVTPELAPCHYSLFPYSKQYIVGRYILFTGLVFFRVNIFCSLAKRNSMLVTAMSVLAWPCFIRSPPAPSRQVRSSADARLMSSDRRALFCVAALFWNTLPCSL